jgi:hypothetical protein
VSGKNYYNHLNILIFMTFAYISPLQGLFLELAILSTIICAALPLKKAAEQQNICSQEIARKA